MHKYTLFSAHASFMIQIPEWSTDQGLGGMHPANKDSYSAIWYHKD